MSRIYVNGTLSPITRPTEIDFDPVRGLVMQNEYHGAGPDSLVGLANTFYNAGIACKLRRGPVSTLTVNPSGGQNGLPDNAQPNWQLLCNEVQKSIFESGYARAGLNSFPSLMSDVQSAWKAEQEGDWDTASSIIEGIPDDERQYFDYLLNKLELGQTSFAQGQYVLKRTLSVSNFYRGELPGEGNVECLLATETLLGESDMPPVMSQKISGIPIPAAHSGYAWGWRQLPSQMVTGAQNRVEVSTEWWFDEWDTVLYGGLI